MSLRLHQAAQAGVRAGVQVLKALELLVKAMLVDITLEVPYLEAVAVQVRLAQTALVHNLALGVLVFLHQLLVAQ